MKQAALTPEHDPKDLLAALVAFITHPVFIGLLGLLTVVISAIDDHYEQLLYTLFLALLTFVPAGLYLLVHFKGNVVDMLELVNREARLIPYILMIVGAVGAIIILASIDAPRPIFVMTLVLLANEIVLGTVNFWTKVSIHTATPTFTALTLGYLVSPVWYWLLLLIPLIAWARVYRRRHTLRQVIGGSLFAALITGGVISLSAYYIM